MASTADDISIYPPRVTLRLPTTHSWLDGPAATEHVLNDPEVDHRGPKRLILCFDGTSENFEGNAADSNIVKLYSKFDRTSPDQLHYYQPGIGTYPTNNLNRLPGLLSRGCDKLVRLFDQAFATSFNNQVMDGYRFLLRYYEQGDKIYIFGFSRGAFIARFLARFVSQIGLLARGNEHLVPFAYSNFLDYQLGTGRKDIEDYLLKFSAAFCRQYNQHQPGPGHVPGVQIHFLGLFDAVNSVAILDRQFSSSHQLPTVHGTAKHIRHAVASDERRVKFRPALLAQDISAKGLANEDMKEVWFPGAHTDIGGGVAPKQKLNFTTRMAAFTKEMRAMTGFGEESRRRHAPIHTLQLGDIALKWMIDELDLIPGDRIKWNSQKEKFLEYYRSNFHEAMDSKIHDAFQPGTSNLLTSLFWKGIEVLPVKRWKYDRNDGWQVTRVPNLGGYRDIPPNSVFHRSVVERLHHDQTYHPKNRVWPQAKNPVKLDRIDTDIVKEADLQPATDSGIVEKILKRIEPPTARFDLYSTGNMFVEQGVEDNTYCAVEIKGSEHGHGGGGSDGAADPTATEDRSVIGPLQMKRRIPSCFQLSLGSL